MTEVDYKNEIGTSEMYKSGMTQLPKVTEYFIYRRGQGMAADFFHHLEDAIEEREKDLKRDKKDGSDEYWHRVGKEGKIFHRVEIEKALDI